MQKPLDEAIKTYKKRNLPTNCKPNSIYYILPINSSAVVVYITDLNGIPIKVIDLTAVGTVQSVTGTGVTGSLTNPKIDIPTFVSSQIGNLIELSSEDGKLVVKAITSPDSSISITDAASELQIQLSAAITAQIDSALQPGANMSNLTNDVGYITTLDVTELAQDAVGTILTDTSTIDLTYTDLIPSITASVKPNSITATELADNINISEFINDSSFETTSQLNVRDTANRNRTNHTGTQVSTTISDFTSAAKTAVVDNSITDGITDKAPSENAVFDALALKQDNLVSGTSIKTLEGQSLLGSGNIDLTKSDVGLSNVDNTSDINKPISTAQQNSLDLKANISGQIFTGAISATNLLGTNNGDETTLSIQTKRPLKTLDNVSIEGVGTIVIPTKAHALTHELGGTDVIQGENLSVNVIPPTNNYSPVTSTLKGHLQGIDQALGTVVQTTAGLTNRIYYTADVVNVSSTNYFASSVNNKGTVVEALQTVINGDDTKSYFAQDIISVPQPFLTTAPSGSFAGQLSVRVSNDSAQERFTVEIYKTNNSGVPIASGITGAPVGNLGVTVVAILDSGIIDLVQNSTTNIPVTGILNSNLTLNVGERLRYHISAEKIGTAGGNFTFSLYLGNAHNSYYDVPVTFNTDTVSNRSLVSGITTSDALNYLNANKEDVVNKVTSLASPNNTNYPTTQLLKDQLDLKIPLTQKGAINGVATLGSDGKVPNNQIPALAISETFPVTSQAAMLALAQAEQGDVAIRSDISKSFILRQSPSSVLANWSELLSPTDAVSSVNGQVGVVTLTTAIITDSANKRYQTDAQQTNNNATSPIQQQIDSKQSTLVSGTTIKTIEGQNILGSGNIDITKADVGLSLVPNTDFTTAVAANTAKTTNQTHTGDATGSTALTLATVNSNVGTFGNASNSITQTVNAKGLTTAISNVPIQIAESQVTGLVSDLAGKEPVFSKNNAFNRSFGSTSLSVAEGNDSRITNGQSAFSWGNHADKYVLNDGAERTDPNTQFQSSSYRFAPHANNPTNTYYAISTYGDNSAVIGQIATHLTTGDTFTRAYNTSWSSWRLLLDNVNFNSYVPTLNGTGASGIWGINISGNSNKAGRLITYDSGNDLFWGWDGKITLQINDTNFGRSVPMDITGNSSNATNWGGQGSNLSEGIKDNITPVSLAGMYSNGGFYQFSANRVSQFLGLGSNAYTSTAYLPLTGGTLSGGINGVSATFSSSVTASSLDLTTGSILLTGGGSGTSIKTVASTFNTTTLEFYTNFGDNAPIKGLSLYNGEATFSSSVTATSFNGSATLTGTPTAPTATAGTNTTQIATTAFVQANSRPYKVYTALLSQSGTSAPTAIVGENTLGGTVVWTRNSTGNYTGTLAGAFTTDKTYLFGLKTSSLLDFSAQWINTDQVILNTANNTTSPFTQSDDTLRKSTLEIRVYN